MDIDTALTRLRRASAAFQSSKAAYETGRAHLRTVIAEAASAGVPQKDIIEVTGYTRENVRQITRAGGVESERPAPVAIPPRRTRRVQGRATEVPVADQGRRAAGGAARDAEGEDEKPRPEGLVAGARSMRKAAAVRP